MANASEAGRLEEAERLSARLIAEHPDVQDGYELRGLTREKQGRWGEAAEAYGQALAATEAMGPKNVDREALDYRRGLCDAARARATGR